MGGVINTNTYCCIHDSTFKDDCKDKDNIETIEQKAMSMGDKTIDKIESFITDISPRKHSKNSNAD